MSSCPQHALQCFDSDHWNIQEGSPIPQLQAIKGRGTAKQPERAEGTRSHPISSPTESGTLTVTERVPQMQARTTRKGGNGPDRTSRELGGHCWEGCPAAFHAALRSLRQVSKAYNGSSFLLFFSSSRKQAAPTRRGTSTCFHECGRLPKRQALIHESKCSKLMSGVAATQRSIPGRGDAPSSPPGRFHLNSHDRDTAYNRCSWGRKHQPWTYKRAADVDCRSRAFTSIYPGQEQRT